MADTYSNDRNPCFAIRYRSKWSRRADSVSIWRRNALRAPATESGDSAHEARRTHRPGRRTRSGHHSWSGGIGKDRDHDLVGIHTQRRSWAWCVDNTRPVHLRSSRILAPHLRDAGGRRDSCGVSCGRVHRGRSAHSRPSATARARFRGSEVADNYRRRRFSPRGRIRRRRRRRDASSPRATPARRHRYAKPI